MPPWAASLAWILNLPAEQVKMMTALSASMSTLDWQDRGGQMDVIRLYCRARRRGTTHQLCSGSLRGRERDFLAGEYDCRLCNQPQVIRIARQRVVSDCKCRRVDVERNVLALDGHALREGARPRLVGAVIRDAAAGGYMV